MVRTTLTPEAKVKKDLKRLLDDHGIFHFSPIAGGMTKAGIPDIIACFGGDFAGIEVKATAKHKLTSLQNRRAQEIQFAGGRTLLIHADNLAWFAELLVDYFKFSPAKRANRLVPFLCPLQNDHD